MSTIEVTCLSTKGQVAIPQLIRDDPGIKPGAKLKGISDGVNVLLKPLESPKLEAFQKLIGESRAYARRVGLKQSDVPAARRRVRNARRR